MEARVDARWHGPSTSCGHEVTAMKNFQVGNHEVRVWEMGDRWFVSVDGLRLPIWHPERVGACAAGIRAAAGFDTVSARDEWPCRAV